MLLNRENTDPVTEGVIFAAQHEDLQELLISSCKFDMTRRYLLLFVSSLQGVIMATREGTSVFSVASGF
jgi:hypothetical protein